MKVHIRYEAEYRYEDVVSFSPHRFRLFPRTDHFTQIARVDFRTNRSADVQHRRDLFDNPVANCFYRDPSEVLECCLELEIVLTERNAFHFLLSPAAAEMPFEYSAHDREVLAPYLAGRHEPVRLPFWDAPSEPGPTVRTLVALNSAIHDNIAYERRDKGEAWAPAQTLEAGRGACRDMTVLLAETLRGQGIAARMASGYLCEFGAEEKRAEGALHAWVEAYLPGAGWVGMDPTNGTFCDHHHITAAIGLTPEDVSPVSGKYFHDTTVNSIMESHLEVLECQP